MYMPNRQTEDLLDNTARHRRQPSSLARGVSRPQPSRTLTVRPSGISLRGIFSSCGPIETRTCVSLRRIRDHSGTARLRLGRSWWIARPLAVLQGRPGASSPFRSRSSPRHCCRRPPIAVRPVLPVLYTTLALTPRGMLSTNK